MTAATSARQCDSALCCQLQVLPIGNGCKSDEAGRGSIIAGSIDPSWRPAAKEAVEEVPDWLNSTRREIGDDVMQAPVSAVLDPPLAVGILFGHCSLQTGTGLQALHQRLMECERDDLALRLLDGAAYHCVESARPLISQHQPEEPQEPWYRTAAAAKGARASG